jgi:hypothetical protein
MFTLVEADKSRQSDAGKVNETSNEQKQAENLPLLLLYRFVYPSILKMELILSSETSDCL